MVVHMPKLTLKKKKKKKRRNKQTWLLKRIWLLTQLKWQLYVELYLEISQMFVRYVTSPLDCWLYLCLSSAFKSAP